MRDPPGSYLETVRNRYRIDGSTITGTTTANLLYQVGPHKGLRNPTEARYATLMADSGGSIYFGRGMALGTRLLASSTQDSYTFDYVNVAEIVIKDNGTPTTFTIDYTGP